MASQDEVKIALSRLQTLPSHVTLNVGCAEGPVSMNKQQLINEVKNGSEIGECVVQMYMEYLRSFK